MPEPLALARRNASAAGVTPTFVRGDVTRLADLVPQGSFDLIVDFGCLHTLPADLRSPHVAAVSAVAAPGATYLLYGFARPPLLAPMPAGLSEAEFRARFEQAGWEVATAEQVHDDPIVVARSRVDRSFRLWRYRLQRLAA